MSFSSIYFLSFILVLVCLYRAIPDKYRPFVLLIANLFFLIKAGYTAIFLFIGIACVTVFCGQRISQVELLKWKRAWLSLCILLIVGTLLITRFSADLFMDGATEKPFLVGMTWLGLSFYSLQAIDYAVWRFKGGGQGISALQFYNYLGFFPKLPAGPIEPAERFFSQSPSAKSVTAEDILVSSKRILWGLFKKIVIADRLGFLAAPILSNPENFSGFEALLGVYALSFQIYCDFSAYCDIAIGVARILGYDLSENFNLPYLARSVREFWHRWHMTLTSWLKRHIYIPLGGNRSSNLGWHLNVLIVFVASGLWHGVGVTFILWSIIHAAYYLLGCAIAAPYSRFRKGIEKLFGNRWIEALEVVFTFHLVALAWIPFASESIDQAWSVFRSLGRFHSSDLYSEISLISSLAGTDILILIIGICVWILASFGKKIGCCFSLATGGGSLLAELAAVDLMIFLIILSVGVPGGEFMYVRY